MDRAAVDQTMCLECKEAMDLVDELRANYGFGTMKESKKIAAMNRAENGELLAYLKKKIRMLEILAACPKSPEAFGKETAYAIARMIRMYERPTVPV